MANKCYSELIQLTSFRERFEYLRLNGVVGIDTFGYNRYLNQVFYNSPEWKRSREFVIFRDNACDLGIADREIHSKIIIHHMNVITMEQVLARDPIIFDPEFLISTTHKTHNAIHYGDSNAISNELITRTKNDTCPWK